MARTSEDATSFRWIPLSITPPTNGQAYIYDSMLMERVPEDIGWGGTVIAVSVATAHGFSGTSSGGSSPILTLGTTVSGIIKGSAGSLAAAVAGTDFVSPSSYAALGDILVGTGAGTYGDLSVGSDGQILVADSAQPLWIKRWPAGGTGTVTTVSVVTANGISGTVANATSTPAITLALGNITPTTVNSIQFSWSSTPALAVTGISAISGSNTGDQTSVTGNAGTATALQTARSIYGENFDGTANLSGIIASTFGGTGNGFAKFSWPTTSEKTFALPNANTTLVGTTTTQALTNKDLTDVSNTFPTSLATLTGVQALTHKDLTDATNTFPTSLVTLTGSQALSNKTGNISQWTNNSGYLTANQTITLSGDVTGSGTTAITTTIKTNVALAGSPTTTTQSASDNSTKIATTAYVDAAVAAIPGGGTWTQTASIAVNSNIQATHNGFVFGYTTISGISGSLSVQVHSDNTTTPTLQVANSGAPTVGVNISVYVCVPVIAGNYYRINRTTTAWPTYSDNYFFISIT